VAVVSEREQGRSGKGARIVKPPLWPVASTLVTGSTMTVVSVKGSSGCAASGLPRFAAGCSGTSLSVSSASSPSPSADEAAECSPARVAHAEGCPGGSSGGKAALLYPGASASPSEDVPACECGLADDARSTGSASSASAKADSECHVFEGPEKILEVDFASMGGSGAARGRGLRDLPRTVWDQILGLARCQIMSQLSNSEMDSYVLSESSLFVYEHKVLIKTCGTTTLLRCLPRLLQEANGVGEELQWLCYSRKNFIFPDYQAFPHNSFAEEIEYTKRCKGPTGAPLKGGAYVLGDLQGDHWYVFSADYSPSSIDNATRNERNVNIMMYGLAPDVCEHFFKHDKEAGMADQMRVRRSLQHLCGDAKMDDWMFSPCGYSANAIDGGVFYTIHVTPEPAFSYASFETNLAAPDYTELVSRVVQFFKPERFVVTVFGDEAAMGRINSSPKHISHAGRAFVRETQSSTMFRDEYACRMEVYKALPEGDKQQA
jgi:S-adenosylmethionine decarboxylase